MTLYVGTSGWQYRHWRESFYPRSLRQYDWLPYFAERFRCVEVNNTFYRLPGRESFQEWAERTPDDFVLGLKFSRFLTHMKRLKDPEEPIERFFSRAEPLGRKLGPVLLQLPERVRAEPERLERALALMPGHVRVAVELRHDSWFSDETYEVLRAHRAALCLADRGSRPATPIERTASWGYVRLHQGGASPRPCYGRAALEGWARRIERLWPASADVYVFFNNDPLGCAVRDAARFAHAAERRGLRPTRVPEPAEVHLGAA